MCAMVRMLNRVCFCNRPALGKLVNAFFISATVAVTLNLALSPTAKANQARGNWVVLFDGSSTEHWRGFLQSEFPSEGWRVEQDALRPIEEGQVIDLITREQYRNFELELEWRVDPKGNSGIFFHVSEEFPEVWYSGPEVQVLDDVEHPDGLDPKTSAGSIYDLVAPTNKVLRPVGEYNKARFLMVNDHLQHWLNGVKILDVDLRGDDFRKHVAASKFSEMPGFAVQPRGHISLQHASVSPLRAPVWFRNVRIRELP
jgi:hypothetical protein